MRTVLVCGDRLWQDREVITSWLAKLQDWGCTTVIHGGARGADTIAGEEAMEMGYEVIEVPAEWARYGKAAGVIRNREMLDLEPDLVLAFHEDILVSKGTADCLKEAHGRGIETILEDNSSVI